MYLFQRLETQFTEELNKQDAFYGMSLSQANQPAQLFAPTTRF